MEVLQIKKKRIKMFARLRCLLGAISESLYTQGRDWENVSKNSKDEFFDIFAIDLSCGIFSEKMLFDKQEADLQIKSRERT